MTKRWLIFILIITSLLFTFSEAEGELTLYALNVGKADCLLLSCDDDIYLIDTGRASTYGVVSKFMNAHHIEHLSGVIVTHTDDDHAGGAMAIAMSGIQRIDAWYISPYYNCKEKNHPVIRAAEVRDQSPVMLYPGDTLPLGDGTLTVLGPLTKDGEIENNNSLVLLAETKDGTILLTGDMEFTEEAQLLQVCAMGEVDVLKVPDHAENHSGSERFFNTVKAKIAVISTNSSEEPDTPSTRVLTALKRAGTRTLITQNAPSAICVTLQNGEPVFSYLSIEDLPAQEKGIVIDSIDKSNDSIVISNKTMNTIDITGWYILSERGNEIFVFPENTVIQANDSITVSALDSLTEGDLLWPDTKVWHKSKTDRALLYDASGQLISQK